MNIRDIKERIKEIDKHLQNINDCYNSVGIEDDFDIIDEVYGLSNEEWLTKEKDKLLNSLKELEKKQNLKKEMEWLNNLVKEDTLK